MSEEEVIKQIKDMIIAFDVQGYIREKGFIKEELKASNVLQEMLDIYKKQEKEIEELKQENENLTLHILDNTKYIKDTISKDKIIDKIKELEELPNNQYIHLDYIKQEFKKLLEG